MGGRAQAVRDDSRPAPSAKGPGSSARRPEWHEKRVETTRSSRPDRLASFASSWKASGMVGRPRRNSDTSARSTLEGTPRRALDFLCGVASSAEIFGLLATAGYSKKVHEEGLRLLVGVAGCLETTVTEPRTSRTHEGAMRVLREWYRTVFRRLRVAAMRLFPEEARGLFANLDLSKSVDEALAARIFLERLDALGARSGLRTLFAERGFGRDEAARVGDAVDRTAPPRVAREARTRAGAKPDASKRDESRQARLEALRAWYVDWSETARTLLVRRDHAIRLGLARRKPRAQRETP